MNYILSLDLGTTAIKVAIIGTDGQMVSSSTMEYSLLTPDVLSVEMPAHIYWENFKMGLKQVLENSKIDPVQILCMGISAQGETLFLLDQQGKELCNAIVWMDNLFIYFLQ